MPHQRFVAGGKFADRHLQTMAGQVPWRDDSRLQAAKLEKLTAMPGPINADKLLNRPVFTARGAVADLGLDDATQSEWRLFLESVTTSSENEPILRQQLFEKMRAQGWDTELRKVMFDRAMSLYRNTRKSVLTPDDLAKGETSPGRPAQVFTPDQLQKADRIAGGRADKRKPSDFPADAVAAGMKHEMEHTDDPKVAREIAMDHLAEDARYYIKLKTIEKATPDGGKTKSGYTVKIVNGKRTYVKDPGDATHARQKKMHLELTGTAEAIWAAVQPTMPEGGRQYHLEEAAKAFVRASKLADSVGMKRRLQDMAAWCRRAKRGERPPIPDDPVLWGNPMYDTLRGMQDFISRKSKPSMKRQVAAEEAGRRSPLSKAEPRGGTYYRRVARKGGEGFDYYYTPEAYNKRKDAHQSGEDMAKRAMGRAVDKAIGSAGDKGCSPKELRELAKKYGGKSVAGHLKQSCGEGGSMSYKGGRFYALKKDTSPEGGGSI